MRLGSYCLWAPRLVVRMGVVMPSWGCHYATFVLGGFTKRRLRLRCAPNYTNYTTGGVVAQWFYDCKSKYLYRRTMIRIYRRVIHEGRGSLSRDQRVVGDDSHESWQRFARVGHSSRSSWKSEGHSFVIMKVVVNRIYRRMIRRVVEAGSRFARVVRA